MAGLLDTIAKRLMGGSNKSTVSTRPSMKTASSTTVKVKPVATQVANDWVKNSTIEEPVIVKTTVSEEDVTQKEIPVPQVTAIDRTVKRERIKNDVEREEDYLLTQIDEFREKAQQLQSLLLSKESKVMELQNIVDEREVKAKELEDILNERQRKADGITAEVSKQIDALIEKVTAKMDEIGVSIEKEVSEGQKITAEQMEELKETLAAVNAQLETIKGELSEKVHTENVKCFRNISDLFKGMDEKVDSIQKAEEAVDKKVKSIHKCTIALIVLTVMNMLGITAVILMELGVFKLFM